MNEKISFQNLSDLFAAKSRVSKKVADSFVKSFFDTIVEALYSGEESVKIKGLGTFKLVKVEDRESVNVSNGERILISGYKKVSFTPEDSVVELLNAMPSANSLQDETKDDVKGKRENVTEVVKAEKNEAMSVATSIAAEDPIKTDDDANITDESSVSLAETNLKEGVEEGEAASVKSVENEVAEESAAEETVENESSVNSTVDNPASESVDEMIAVEVPQVVEVQDDEFSGIDLLISTPESVEDVRMQYDEAKQRLDECIEEARRANSEKQRLEKLLERLESNCQPETMEEVPLSNDEDVKDVMENVEQTPDADNDNEEVVNASTEHENEKVMNATSETLEAEPEEIASSEPPVPTPIELETKAKKNGYVWLLLLVLLLLIGIGWGVYKFSQSGNTSSKQIITQVDDAKDGKSNNPNDADNVVQPEVTDSVETPKDSIVNTVQKEEEKQVEEQKPEIPKTYRIKKGDSLTRISQMFYGTKDSLSAILRINKFKDPNNVPVGCVINLP